MSKIAAHKMLVKLTTGDNLTIILKAALLLESVFFAVLM